MNTIKQRTLILSITALLLSVILPAMAQDATPQTGSANNIKIDKPFDAIEVGGALRLFLVQGEEQKVDADYPEALDMSKLVNVDGNTLTFSMKGIQKPDKLKIYVTFKTLSRLESSGASNVKGLSPFKAEHFNIEASGASKVELEVSCTNIIVEASGACDVKLSGKADIFNLEATGASNVKALELTASKATVEASGASNVRMDVRDEITGETSGAAKLSLKQQPARLNIDPSGASKVIVGEKVLENQSGKDESQVVKLNDSQTITINEDGVTIKSDSGEASPLIINDDGVKVVLNEKVVDGKTESRVLVINDDGVKVVDKESKDGHSLPWRKKNKYNGHWAGYELGLCGYVDKNFSSSLPDSMSFLDLRMEKCYNNKINIFEQNINLINNHFGMTTGIGFEWCNYRFSNNVILVQDTSVVYGYKAYEPGKSYEKSKLVVTYLNVPLFFEWQTNGKAKTSSFHVGAGMIFGWRIGTHTKNIINGSKVKQKDDFNLQNFKYDLTARIGWGVININATYALNTMFREGTGPEVYPFSLGLTLVSF